MHFTFSWKKGLLGALIFVVVGIGLFLFVGSKMDFSCRNTTPVSGSCRIYNGFNAIVQGYTDFWRQFFAPRCIGGGGPDDCLGPDFGIMFFTLAGTGFIIGGTSRKKNGIAKP